MKVANVNIITDTAKIDAAIASVATKGKSLDQLIHRTAVSCVYHSQQHGDTTKLCKLVDVMPKSGRRKALIAWVEAHVPVDADETNDTKEGYTIKLRKGRKPEDFLVSEAASVPFWDFTVERVPVPMTLERAIAAFEKAIAKAVEQGNATESDANAVVNAVAAVRAANDGNNPGLTAVA